MITIEEEGVKFQYRVAGVTMHNGRVLLHRADDEPFWTLPGGRAEMLETAEQTLKREMREELNADVQVGKLLWVIENFFGYKGESFHELGLYFEMSFPEESPLLVEYQPFEGYEEGTKLIFRWYRLDETESLYILPSFFNTGLSAMPSSPVHLVHNHGEA